MSDILDIPNTTIGNYSKVIKQINRYKNTLNRACSNAGNIHDCAEDAVL